MHAYTKLRKEHNYQYDHGLASRRDELVYYDWKEWPTETALSPEIQNQIHL